jgi:hypothetical protein
MKSCKRMFALFLSFSLVFLSVSPAHAAMVSNSQLVSPAQQDDRAALLQTLARADVQAQMSAMGVDAADVSQRVNQMTPDEISQLNQKMAELPAGGDALGIIVLIFLVFIITDIIGATDVFPFVHPVK